MMKRPIVMRGILGWGNRKGGLEAYGPGGRWHRRPDANKPEAVGDLLGDALDQAGAGEGAHLIVIAVPRHTARPHGDADSTAVADRIEGFMSGLLRAWESSFQTDEEKSE